MNLDLAKLFEPSYLFSKFPGQISKSFMVAWLVVGVVLIIAGTVIKIFAKKYNNPLPVWIQMRRRVGNWFIASGFVFVVFLFFRYERTPWLSVRAWILVWLVCVIAWGAYLGFVALKKAPTIAKEQREQARIRKYLPN